MALSVPNTFTAGTTILSDEVDANFAALLDAVDKRGDTMTGDLAMASTKTVDGVDISAVIGAGGTLLAVNGAAVTALNASNLASGTVPLARLPVITYQTTQTANYPIDFANGSDQTILCNTNAFTATLPTAVGATGKRACVVKIGSDSNAITIATTSSQTLGQHASGLKLYKQDDYITVESDGANWKIVGEKVTISATVYLSSSQTITTATDTKVGFNAELHDTAAAFDAATNFRFTAPRAGEYSIQSVLSYDNGANSSVTTRVKKNGTTVSRAIYGSTLAIAAAAPPTDINLQLAAGDYVEIWTEHAHGSNRDILGSATFYSWASFRYVGN